MGRGELDCPICTADIPLSGDEKQWDTVVCPYCAAPSRLTKSPTDEDCELEEDF